VNTDTAAASAAAVAASACSMTSQLMRRDRSLGAVLLLLKLLLLSNRFGPHGTRVCGYKWHSAGHWRSEGGAGRTGRHLLGAANGRKLFLKIRVKIQIVISYVFACNKNKALQLHC